MTIESIDGSAYIKQGGISETPAYPGMVLHSGDSIISGSGGLVLVIKDEGDRITLAPYSELQITTLTANDVFSTTILQLVKGGAYLSVHDLTKTKDIFEWSTPEQQVHVKGTHFYTSVDPLTGTAMIWVGAGVVQVNSTDSSVQNVLTYLLPTQLSSIDSGKTPSIPSMMDIESFINSVTPDVIKAIIQAKADIDQENAEFIAKKKQEIAGGATGNDANTSLSNKDEAELAKVKSNLDSLIANIALQAIKSNKISVTEMDKIIQEANQKITDSNRKLDLNHVTPLDPSAGVDTELQKKKEEELRKLAEMKKAAEEKKRQELLEKQEELKKQLSATEEKRKQLEGNNRKAKEEEDRKAQEAYLNQLSESEQARFKEEAMRRGQEQAQIQGVQLAPPLSSGHNAGGSTVTPPTGPPVTPPVIPPVDPPVTPPVDPPIVDPVPKDFSVVIDSTFQDTVQLGNDHMFDFGFKSDTLPEETKVKVKLTYSTEKDVDFTGLGYYYSFNDRITSGNLTNNESVTLGTYAFKDLSGTPINFRTHWNTLGKYDVTIELVNVEGSAGAMVETSLGFVRKKFEVTEPVEDIIVKENAGETLDYILNTPDSSMSSTELGLDLSIRTEEGNKAPAAHFVLLYGDTIIANAETDNDGKVSLWPSSEEGRILASMGLSDSPKQYTLQWREPAVGNYKVMLQWINLKNEKAFNPIPVHFIFFD
ncbi:FecR domain-containing protein [Paenibacillus antarcticus]|uniref:FecR protein domain-containing protein n=1 Tax=Paenibacillus antarcticus TaxID=253703 RepID=A0A162LX93_9BACL|nr:FecR domain-containing protein [Paenibacillus antarcticus]OAB41167.1 hypothetical protein PBAT_21665 [Paenibacillus antarcticus]